MSCTCFDVGPMCGYCSNEVALAVKRREAKNGEAIKRREAKPTTVSTEQERRRYALLQAATVIYTQGNQTVDVAVSRAAQLLHIVEEQEKA